VDVEIIVVWLLLCLVPAYIAGQKGNSAAVAFLVSLLLSPLVGLIIAVIQKPAAQPSAPPSPTSAIGVADELAKLGQLRDSGAISAEEFDRQRAILLPPMPSATRPVGGWGPTSQAAPGMVCGNCQRPLSPVWQGRCEHCRASYSDYPPMPKPAGS
jgi:hypothetical protein